MDSDLEWVAGWLEGEGSFGLYGAGPCVQAQSTDCDVVEEAARILGLKIHGPYRDLRTARRKPYWSIKANGQKASELMRILLPYMRGSRRRAKILSILRPWEELMAHLPSGD